MTTTTAVCCTDGSAVTGRRPPTSPAGSACSPASTISSPPLAPMVQTAGTRTSHRERFARLGTRQPLRLSNNEPVAQSTVGRVPIAEAVGGTGLWERKREIAAINGLIADAAAGAGRLALVEGVAGIGKSRLMVEAQTLAGLAGFQVLTARGGELEQPFPFGVVRQLFERALTDPQIRERWLSGAADAAATVFGSVERHSRRLASFVRRAARPLLVGRQRLGRDTTAPCGGRLAVV